MLLLLFSLVNNLVSSAIFVSSHSILDLSLYSYSALYLMLSIQNLNPMYKKFLMYIGLCYKSIDDPYSLAIE